MFWQTHVSAAASLPISTSLRFNEVSVTAEDVQKIEEFFNLDIRPLPVANDIQRMKLVTGLTNQGHVALLKYLTTLMHRQLTASRPRTIFFESQWALLLYFKVDWTATSSQLPLLTSTVALTKYLLSQEMLRPKVLPRIPQPPQDRLLILKTALKNLKSHPRSAFLTEHKPEIIEIWYELFRTLVQGRDPYLPETDPKILALAQQGLSWAQMVKCSINLVKPNIPAVSK